MNKSIIIWAIIGIVLIVASVAIYAAFAKTTTSTGGGGFTKVSEGFLGFLKGLHLSIIGK